MTYHMEVLDLMLGGRWRKEINGPEGGAKEWLRLKSGNFTANGLEAVVEDTFNGQVYRISIKCEKEVIPNAV